MPRFLKEAIPWFVFLDTIIIHGCFTMIVDVKPYLEARKNDIQR